MSDIVTKAKNLGKEYVIGHKMKKPFADPI
jgi:hypothetical protein